MLVIGAVFALGMATTGVSVIHEAAAAEAAPVMQPVINRYDPPSRRRSLASLTANNSRDTSFRMSAVGRGDKRPRTKPRRLG